MVDVNDYIRQKYNLGNFSQEDRDALVKANEEAKNPLLAGLAAFGAGLGGGDVGQAYSGAIKSQQSQTQNALGAFDKNRADTIQNVDFQRNFAKAERDDRNDLTAQDKAKRESDPNSQESNLARTLAARMVPGQNFDGLSAAQINGLIPSLTKIYEIQQRNSDRLLARQDRDEESKLRRNELNERRDEQLALKKEESENKDVQKLSDKIGNAQELLEGLTNVESKLGFKLDDATVEKGKIKVAGEDRDLPGISIPGYGRASLGKEEALNLDSAIGRVFNTVLKDRSGAAVTSNEMDRLKEEFGRGRWNSEAALVQGLKDYRMAVANELRNREAGFKPEVVDRYRSRSGVTSADLKGAGLNKVEKTAGIYRVRDPKGNIRLVPADQLAAALNAKGVLLDEALAGGQ